MTVWALLATAYFLAAIGLNAIVVRLMPLPPLVSFFATGSLLGLALIGHALHAFGVSVFALASVLSYMAACELFLIVMTMLNSSIAVRSIRFLGQAPMTESALAELYDARGMVELRLERIHAAGLAENGKGVWRLTASGKRLLNVLQWLRTIFGHERSPTG